MKLNSKTHKKRIGIILIFSPVLFTIVVTSLVMSAKAHNMLEQQIPGLVGFISIAIFVFGRIAHNIKISVNSLELINDELRIDSPKYGYLILKRDEVRMIERGNKLISPIDYLTIFDSEGRKHRMIIPSWIDESNDQRTIDTWSFVINWWTTKESYRNLPKIKDIRLIRKKKS